jgi:predicted AlkP superfamily pyrophosphatase or phosphodiesterase
MMGARSSADIRAHDRTVFLEEEERDKLLLEEQRRRGRRGSALAMAEPLKRLFSKSYTEFPPISSSIVQDMDEKSGLQQEKRRKRRERRSKKKEKLLGEAANGEDGSLMCEMEQGGMKEGSLSGSSSENGESEELDRAGLLGLQDDKISRKRRWRVWCFVHLLIAIGFSILVLVSWRLSLKRRNRISTQTLLSNGTALFAPTTIMISLDGFRADFLNRGITPRLNAFIKEGISPPYMNPSFPSVTFPNHYTIVTGMYPESHGIVGNTFWDEELQEEFFYTNPNAMQPKWWAKGGVEPLWVHAEKAGIRTGIHMWPGSEAHIGGIEPAFLDQYNGKEALKNKVSRVLEMLDKPGIESNAELIDMRPQLALVYVPNVDGDGHSFGPNSTEIDDTIKSVDDMLDGIFKGIEERNLTNIVNIVIVSDHGMATTDLSRLIQLEDLVDPNLIEHTDGWPLYGLRPKKPELVRQIYHGLSVLAAKSENFDVYLRDTNMPERYHFSKNERIAPLWIVPKVGWAIVTKQEFDIVDAKAKGLQYHPRGLHGYDHEHPLMRAIFIARGPAFPHAPNSRMEPFQNIEIYNIICDSLGLEPSPNNGTLRLPLKPVGLHTPETWPETPEDPQPSSSMLSTSTPAPTATPESFSPPTAASTSTSAEPDVVFSISPIEASSAADPNEKPPAFVGVDETIDPQIGDPQTDRPVVPDETVVDLDEDFWDWLKDKVEGVKTWFGTVIGEHGKGGDGEGEGGDGVVDQDGR